MKVDVPLQLMRLFVSSETACCIACIDALMNAPAIVVSLQPSRWALLESKAASPSSIQSTSDGLGPFLLSSSCAQSHESGRLHFLSIVAILRESRLPTCGFSLLARVLYRVLCCTLIMPKALTMITLPTGEMSTIQRSNAITAIPTQHTA